MRSNIDELLVNTCVPENVKIDLENMRSEFEQTILPFLNAHKERFRFVIIK